MVAGTIPYLASTLYDGAIVAQQSKREYWYQYYMRQNGWKSMSSCKKTSRLPGRIVRGIHSLIEIAVLLLYQQRWEQRMEIRDFHTNYLVESEQSQVHNSLLIHSHQQIGESDSEPKI